jgi:hypothetical protein
MTSGWSRYVLEQYHFDFDVVFPPQLDRGDLRSQYDIIILPSGVIPNRRPQGNAGETGAEMWLDAESAQPQNQANLAEDRTIPFEYRRRIGSVSARTLAELQTFAEQGGTVFCIGSSATNVIQPMGLPVKDALVDEGGTPYPNTKFYIPGSLMRVDFNDVPLTRYLAPSVAMMFDESPSFRPTESRAQAIGTYTVDKPLLSGWAWGQELLKGSAAVVSVQVGRGKVILCGPELLFRGQSNQSYRLLFNAIDLSVGGD